MPVSAKTGLIKSTGGKTVKIECTKNEQNYLMDVILTDNDCPIREGSCKKYQYNCMKCLENEIEWRITDGEDN